MVERFIQNKLLWINLKNPSIDDIKRAGEELNIPFLMMNDLSTPVPKNSATEIDGYIKITLDFPVVKRIDIQHPYEVKFIFSKNCLLTIQYEEMEGIDRFKRQFEVATTLRRNQKGISGAHLFVSLINHLYDSASTKLDYIETRLSDIESEIFKDNEKKMVFEIADISKKLINFRHILRSHEDVFREATPFLEVVYKNSFSKDLQSIQAHYFSLLRRTNTFFDTLTALRETNTAMLTTHQNEVIKNLTLMAFITFPLSLLLSIFTIKSASNPILGQEHDFLIIVAILVLGAIALLMFFKRKKWI